MTEPAFVLAPGVRVRVAPPVLPRIEVARPSPTAAVLVPVTGPRGPKGDVGGESVIHHQAVPQAVWTVEHGMGKYPVAWSLFDTDGQLCGEYLVEHLDEDTLRVSMDIPTAGTLRLI